MNTNYFSQAELEVCEIVERLQTEKQLSRRFDIWHDGAKDFLVSKEELSGVLQSLRKKGVLKCTKTRNWRFTDPWKP